MGSVGRRIGRLSIWCRPGSLVTGSLLADEFSGQMEREAPDHDELEAEGRRVAPTLSGP